MNPMLLQKIVPETILSSAGLTQILRRKIEFSRLNSNFNKISSSAS